MLTLLFLMRLFFFSARKSISSFMPDPSRKHNYLVISSTAVSCGLRIDNAKRERQNAIDVHLPPAMFLDKRAAGALP